MILLCGLLVIVICRAVGSGCFQGSASNWGTVHAGVPQGSILGPLLFSIYVNNLPSVVHGSQLNMYCDDMELHCSSGDLLSAQCRLQSAGPPTGGGGGNWGILPRAPA